MGKLNEDAVKALPVPENGKGPKVHYFAGAVLQGTAAPSGFGVCVTPGNSRSFVIDYRDADRRQRRYTIGQWPTWSALAAVKEARELRKRIDRGEDPLAGRRKAAAAAKETFRAIAEEYFRRDGKDLRRRSDRESALERLVYPEIGDKDIAGIKRSEIVAILDKIEDKKAGKEGNEGGPVQADRTLAYIRKIFNWHASRTDDFNSPIVSGMARTSSKERARKRILSDAELRAVWSAAGATPTPYGTMVKFILLTGARRSEAAGMSRGELSGDQWVLPARRNKTKVDLLRPLSADAFAVLPRKTGNFVFSTDGGETSVSGFSKAHRAFLTASGTSGWTLHDLRRTARTLMSRAGADPDHAERCLGHVIPGIRGVYDLWEFRDEKADVYRKLAGVIGQIIAANMTPLQRSR